jgi:signal transduction histidine kinase
MYKRARLKLTLIYSAISFSLFWLISLCLYLWFSESLGQGYITEVRHRHLSLPFAEQFGSQNETIVRIAGNVALEELREIILVLNGGLLLIVPTLGWFLTGRTLAPIEKSYEQQKEFVSDASHEMRTPLSILSGEMEVALKKNRVASYYKGIIESSKEEINRLTQLIESLLFLARSDHAKQPVEFQEVDITDLLNSLLVKFNFKINHKKLKIEFIPAEKIITTYGQTSMLINLFSNLLDNAIKYTPDKGNIWIKVASRKRFAVISIKDSGIGISKEEQRKIFDRFYRADISRSKPRGFGLGLAIVKSIVDLHQGKISVSSKEGKGSTFTVYLPETVVI